MIELVSDSRLHALLFNKLMVEGGAVIRSSECSEMEIAFAKVDGRFFVFEDGTAVVLRSKEWLENAMNLVAQWS